MNLLVCIPNLALLLIEPLAVIHYPADRRVAVRRDLYEVQVYLASFTHRLRYVHNADLTILFVD
jgi:hypothetical protein